MDLDLDVPLNKIITCTVEGFVDEDDLRILASGVAPSTLDPEGHAKQQLEEAEDPSDLKRVRERHHSVARLMAQGMQQSLVAVICNYEQSYLSILLNNPAMQELITMYRLQQGSVHQVIGEKLRTVGLKAMERLEERIDADKLNSSELIAAGKLGLDRSGHGPTSTQRNINETHLLDHAKLAELNKRAREGSREFIVPISEVRQALLPAPDPEPFAELASDSEPGTEA